MCGIFGIVSLDGRPVEPGVIDKGVRILRHRGPDGEGTLVTDDALAALAHTRLAIIGLQDGAQPISNEDGQTSIIVNGEFYDFERIRTDLESRGHRFKTHSDAEIAVHLYEDYGIDCLTYLRGEFALAIWDNRRQRLFAARDRFGIKPLYYSVHNGSLYLASECKALFEAGIDRLWDTESFFHAANMQYVLPHRTLFANINQLRPGHYLVVENGKVTTATYWDLDYICDSAIDTTDEADLIEQFRHELSEAVRLRLRADIPVSCHLSGGLDSSAILGLAMQHSRTPLQCFTVSFNEESYDELDIAREMAAYAGADFHPVHVSQKDLIEALSDAVYFSEGLAVNGHLPAKYLLHEEINRLGYKVTLTGEGSDEVVAGYPHLRSDLFTAEGKSGLLADLHATNVASQGIMLKHGQSLSLTAVAARLDYVPSFLEAKGTLGYKVCSVLADEFLARYDGKDCYDELIGSFDVQQQLSGRNRVNQSLYLWSKTALANYILKTLGDGTEMAHAVEGRLPFLDHKLFEFVRKLPVSLKIKGTVEKYVLREAVRPVITDTIYRRQKHPFVAPPLSRFSDPDADALLQDALRSQSFRAVPFFDHSKMTALLDKLPHLPADEQAAVDPVLMMAMSTRALHERLKLQVA